MYYYKKVWIMALICGNISWAAIETSPHLSRSTTVRGTSGGHGLERSRTILAEHEIDARLSELPGWEKNGSGHLFKEFKTGKGLLSPEDYSAITHAMDDLKHHARLVIAWGTCAVETWTHRPLGITELDFELAKAIEALFSPSK